VQRWPATIDPTWTSEWFDFNHISSSSDHVFIGTNVFGLGGKSMFRSVVLRISFQSILDALAAGGSLDIEFLEDDLAGTLHCVHGATDTMYIAGHIGTDTVRLYRWDASDPKATSVDIAVSPWDDATYSAPGPDGSDWITRADDRITGAWLSGGRVGLMWSSGSLNTKRPLPYVRVVIIDPATSAVVAEPDIWSDEVAYAWPSARPNADGQIGVTMFRGGGQKNPGHVVGGWDEAAEGWVLTVAVDGTNGPNDDKWGDYVTCCVAGDAFLAAGYTLQGGGTLQNVAPDLVEFALV